MGWWQIRAEVEAESAEAGTAWAEAFLGTLSAVGAPEGTLAGGRLAFAVETEAAELSDPLSQVVQASRDLHVRITELVGLERGRTPSVMPQLVGTTEIAAMLGVTPARVTQLSRLRGFPQAMQVAAGRFWTRASVEQWLATWPRKRGRPSKRRTPAERH